MIVVFWHSLLKSQLCNSVFFPLASRIELWFIDHCKTIISAIHVVYVSINSIYSRQYKDETLTGGEREGHTSNQSEQVLMNNVKNFVWIASGENMLLVLELHLGKPDAQ